MSVLSPSKVTNVTWLYAYSKTIDYPLSGKNGGKWLIFVDIWTVDRIWNIIKKATEDGLLGDSSKVSTAKHSELASDSKKVICVYTYDWRDEDDAMRIREALRELGIKNKIPYKTNEDTLNDKYIVNGYKNISKYYK